MIRLNNNKPVEDKEAIREHLNKDIEAFIAQGGKIEKHEIIHYTLEQLQRDANFKRRIRAGL